ncbi:sugar ABC transporter permease [Ruminococcaceae bacterium OttesenSCG-928-D13]|nr:sugar ABC transporter permease [Ruminococcaceae bacterium OttesenSCG-928-D13]
MKKSKLTRDGRQAIYGMLYILPSFLIIMVFCIISIALAAYFSFTNYNLYNAPEFVGLNNYVNVFKSGTFYAALTNTVKYVIVVVPLQTILALLLAVFIAEKMRNRYGSFLRSVIFIPFIVSSIAASAVWKVIFKTKGGILNVALGLFGIDEVNWLGAKTLAFVCVCIVTIWKNVGYYMVIYYAGVMGISLEQKEAAIVDGANAWQRFWRITLPSLKPITYMIITLGVISSFQIFDIVYQLTGGGPGTSTITLAYMVYTYAFSNQKLGYASAIAMVLLVIVLLIHWIQNAFFKEKE